MATKKQAGRRIEYRPLDEIAANPDNPKAHDVDTINDSVARFGYIDGVVIDERTGYLISGHGRTKSLRAMRDRGEAPPDGVHTSESGAWLVPVQMGWASRTDAEAKAALIALNQTTILGGWVDESLLTLLDNLDDHTGVGFTDGDIEDLRARLDGLTDVPIPGDGGGTGRPPFEAKDLPGVQELVTLHHGDCIEVMRTMADESVDAIVTDPPYGLGFMGKDWDDLPPGKEWAEECLRLLKPGGHLLAFGGSRTWHRLAAAVEDAGFEIRDSIAWLYGSGFPKSLDVAKAIDKAAGVAREVVGTRRSEGGRPTSPGAEGQDGNHGHAPVVTLTAPATPDAERWQGWGTALKPAFEPIVVGRKPLAGTVAANVLAHGTGALNVDGCRVGTTDELTPAGGARVMTNEVYGKGLGLSSGRSAELGGRWPANVVLDDTQAAELDRQSGERPGGAFPGVQGTQPGAANGTMGGGWSGDVAPARAMGDTGGASRFFPTFRYEAKAPTSERPRDDDTAHPTVKPLDLMRWLVRLVTPPGGVVLDPFAGSGTTLEAAVLEGFACVGIEREASYLPLIRQRLGIGGDDQL